MTFRQRITIVSAAAVAIAVVLASLLTYVLTSNQLHSQVDRQLRNRAHETARLKRLFSVGSIKVGADGSASLRLTAPGAFAVATRAAEGDLAPRGDEASDASKGTSDSLPHKTITPSPEGSRPGSLFGKLPHSPDQVRGYQQVVEPSGKVLARSVPNVTLPVDAGTRVLASKGGVPFFRSVRVRRCAPACAGRALRQQTRRRARPSPD